MLGCHECEESDWTDFILMWTVGSGQWAVSNGAMDRQSATKTGENEAGAQGKIGDRESGNREGAAPSLARLASTGRETGMTGQSGSV